MTSLVKPKLGTDPVNGWAFYQTHLAAAYVLKEFFLTSQYKASMAVAMREPTHLQRAITEMEKFGSPLPHREIMLANARATADWAQQMQSENYHDMYTHALVSMWAAFEAGMENSAAAFIEYDRQAAAEASALFKDNRYPIASWPWPRELCLSVAQGLDLKAKNATPNGGINIFNRLQTLFAWLGIKITSDDRIATGLAEACSLRNIILHRYGEISSKDAMDIPSFAPWVGKVIPITEERFTDYYNAISGTLILTITAIAESRHVSDANDKP